MKKSNVEQSTIRSFIRRFREEAPLSEEERIKPKREDFWWLDQNQKMALKSSQRSNLDNVTNEAVPKEGLKAEEIKDIGASGSLSILRATDQISMTSSLKSIRGNIRRARNAKDSAPDSESKSYYSLGPKFDYSDTDEQINDGQNEYDRSPVGLDSAIVSLDSPDFSELDRRTEQLLRQYDQMISSYDKKRKAHGKTEPGKFISSFEVFPPDNDQAYGYDSKSNSSLNLQPHGKSISEFKIMYCKFCKKSYYQVSLH